MSKRIHIVSFDVPYPADYGGVIDVFSRVKWFSENEWEVILHCFEYKRPRAKELEEFAEVHYYKRPIGLKHWFSKTPFIVKTRIHSELEKLLENTKDEVLLEGLHCSHYLNLQPGKFYLRAHNIEHDYYRGLARKATGLKKRYFNSEANKLEIYEPILSKAKGLLVISEKELGHFKRLNSNSVYVPPVFEASSSYQKTEPFVLFHGNLSVEENDEAAQWILDNIVPNSDAKFVIAGKNPSKSLKVNCISTRTELIENPSMDEMEKLISTARIHLLWTKNSSGLKLKFLNAMLNSGHVICNTEIVEGSGLKRGYHLANKQEQAISSISELIHTELDLVLWRSRHKDLKEEFDGHQLKKVFSKH